MLLQVLKRCQQGELWQSLREAQRRIWHQAHDQDHEQIEGQSTAYLSESQYEATRPQHIWEHDAELCQERAETLCDLQARAKASWLRRHHKEKNPPSKRAPGHSELCGPTVATANHGPSGLAGSTWIISWGPDRDRWRTSLRGGLSRGAWNWWGNRAEATLRRRIRKRGWTWFKD